MSRGSESDLGHLHGLVTKLLTLKAESMLTEAEELELLDAGFVINTRDVQAISSFLEKNGITCSIDEAEEGNPLKDKLDRLKAKQKGKVVSFQEAVNE